MHRYIISLNITDYMTTTASDLLKKKFKVDFRQNLVLKIVQKVRVIEKQCTGTGAIKRQIPILNPKREINKYYK